MAAEVGNRVLIEMEKTSFFKAVIIVYFLPLLALLGGIGLVYLLNEIFTFSGGPDLWAIGVGFVFFGLTYVVIRRMEPNFKGKPEYNPSIVRIVEDFEEITDFCGHTDD